MMSDLKIAKLSPRMEHGVLCWYRGDTFTLLLKMTLTDQDGEPVALEAEDRAVLTFLDRSGRTVQELVYTGAQVLDGVVTLVMDEALTALFTPGRYRLDLWVHHGDRTTVVKGSPIKVE